MDTSANTITTMGIISNEVYNTTPGKDYFSVHPDDMIVNGTTYKVIDHTDTTTDMQALLLESGGQYVIAFRGTAGVVDILTDAVIGFDNINGQFIDAASFVERMVLTHGINTANLTLTGHSLGGILSQQVGAALHIQGYAFNPYGVDRLLSMMPNSPLVAVLEVALYQIMKAVGLGAPQAAWAKDNILNVSFNDFGTLNGDILSNIVTELTSGHLGSYLPIYGKDVWLEGHLMSVLNPAIAHYDAVLSHFTDKNYNLLTAAYVSVGNYEKTEKIFSDAGVYNASITGLKFNFLADDSASSIASKAKGDPAVLYALAKLNPFAIEGNLPAYANLNRTDMSKQYIEDRAQYLYYFLDRANRYDIDPTLSMTHYEDAALGSDYTLKQTFSRSRILFGGEGKSTLNGGDNGDHLYGMGGDDTLTGNGGDDYMEGGQGFDKYIAGNGDTIKDSDGSGRVLFEGTRLTKGIAQKGECSPDGDGTYKGDGGTYTLSNGTLTFVKGSQTLTIQKFVNGALGITLTSENPGGSCPPPPPPAPTPGPGTPTPNFSSPLVLDLNGDGITSTFISQTDTYFDLDSNGTRERTGWAQTDDGILSFDKNQDGVINNGTELFGNNTILKNGTKAANGFEALREYDENKDGVIDAKDNIYNALSLWQDQNSDGITNAGELHTLSDLGVASINLGYTQTNDYEEQNTINQTSTFTTTTGETKAINDVWFMTNTQDTARDTTITLKDTVAVLPDYRGAGRAENLSTAMNSNAKLESAVTVLLTKSSTATYSSLLTDAKNILALWTKTDNISADATRGEQWILNHNYSNAQPWSRYRVYAYARDVAILETFWGQNFTMNIDGQTTREVIGTEMSAYMTNAINTLTHTVLATLLVQQLYGKEAYDVTQGEFDYTGLFGKLTNTLNTGTTAEKTTAANLLSTLIHRDGLETLSHLEGAHVNDSSTFYVNSIIKFKIQQKAA